AAPAGGTRRKRPRRALGSDREGRHDVARLRRLGRPRRLLPARSLRLRTGRAAVPRLRRADPRGPHRATVVLLLRPLPAALTGNGTRRASPSRLVLQAPPLDPPAGKGQSAITPMDHSRDLVARFEAYADWRRRLSAGISALHGWLEQQDLADAQIDVKVQHLLERLQEDKLVVAFVAEFSRGKSELINAIFFADFGQRMLPSSAGRTTMCPTELLHDPSRPPSIRLLPIETRLNDATVTEFKNYADEWVTFPLDLGAAERMAEALARVSQVKRVPIALARKYGLFSEGDEDILSALEKGDEGSLDIPCW